MEVGLPNRLRFGAFEFDLKAGELRKGARKVLLQEQPFQLLLMLVEHRGDIVTLDEIKKRLWPNDTVVEFDHSIHNAMKKLRRALGDSADNPKYVETVARRGYRLIVRVEWESDSSSDPALAVAKESSSDPPAPAEASQPGFGNLTGKKVSHYRVLEILGGGGMGVVYKAEDLKLGRQVALKVLPEEVGTDPTALKRFEREARAASALDHPNICAIHEFGEHDGQPFIVMPLLEGQTLRDRLAGAVVHQSGSANTESRPFTNDEMLDLALQVTDGLEVAHQKGIIHRDIKPANIFITSRGEVKILDFGLAKLLEYGDDEAIAETHPQATPLTGAAAGLHLTRSGVALGTAGYMSPEQVRGEKLDSRTDIFSFGLVLYEMATGQRAFSGETAAAVQDAILHQEPRPARQLTPKLSPKVEQIIGKALQKNRELRYQDASEISADLKMLERPSPIRHWVAPIAAVCVLVLIVAAALWILRREPTALPEPKLKQLTANSTENPVDSANISPDGKYLAYKDLQGLHLKLLETGETRDIPRPEEISRVNWDPGPWFPDGKKLLLNGGSEEGHHFSVWELSIPEGAPHRVVDDGVAGAVSPDGSLVALSMHAGRIGTREIWLMDQNGEHPRKWLETDEDGNLGRMMWFSDGRRILYAREHQGPNTYQGFIETRAVAGGPSTTVISSGPYWGAGGLRDHYLLADGRLIYLLGEQGVNGPSCNYWQMQLDQRTGKPKGKPRQLTNWAGVCMDFTSATADGKRLVFTKWSSEGALYVANVGADGTRITMPRRLTLNDASELPVGWTPDSRSVLFESNVNGRLEIFRQALDKDTAEPILASVASSPGVLMQQDRAMPSVTPHGDWLLYPVFSEGGRSSVTAELIRAPITGGPPQLVLSAALYDAPRCTRLPANRCVLAELDPDGKQLVFTSFDPVRGRGDELTRFEIGPSIYNGSGADTSSNAFIWDLSPDGTRIALLKRRENQVHILATSGRTVHEVTVKGWNSIAGLNWTADGKGFFVSSRREDSSVLLHVDLQGNPRIVWEQKGWESLRCVPSPDGRHLAILAFKLNNNVWMMEHF